MRDLPESKTTRSFVWSRMKTHTASESNQEDHLATAACKYLAHSSALRNSHRREVGQELELEAIHKGESREARKISLGSKYMLHISLSHTSGVYSKYTKGWLSELRIRRRGEKVGRSYLCLYCTTTKTATGAGRCQWLWSKHI